MKRVVLCCLAALLVFSAAGCASTPSSDAGAAVSLQGKKVAYIMQMAQSDIFGMWSESAEKTAEALGMNYQAFFCDGSDAAWRDTITRCAAEGYDGLLISHGGQAYAYSFLSELMQQYPDLKVVAFDTVLQDENGAQQTIDGVTQIFQQDAQLAEGLLDYLCHTLYADKTAAGEPVNILKVWVGPGYLAAFDRREVGYAAYEEQGLIRTVETIGPADFTRAGASMAEVAEETLANYQPGEIDAIWCCYDLYAGGVYTALRQGGYDIPMVSVDICDADIQKMAEENSPWKACATTNWNQNGEFGMRVLALELAGAYEHIIDPMTGQTSDWLELPVSIVTQDMVAGGGISVTNLDTVADSSYSDRSWMPTADWMAELLGD